jgi:hypothetical protein
MLLTESSPLRWLRRKGGATTLKPSLYPSLALFFMGYADWLTTIVGIAYFGAVELNPLFAEITRTNLVAFTAIKMTTAIFTCLLFYAGETMLLRLKDRDSKYFSSSRIILMGGYVIMTTVLLIAILNNVIVVARSI